MNITLYDKRDFAEVMNLRILRGGDNSGLLGEGWRGDNVITGSLCEESRNSQSESNEIMWSEAEIRVTGFADGGRDRKSRNVSSPRNWKSQGIRCFSSEPLEGTHPARGLPLAQVSLPQELEDSKFVLF